MIWAVRHHQRGTGRRPYLVWLHGLLGSGDDWSPVLTSFADWPLLTLDLPGHGGSVSVPPHSFTALSAGLSQTLTALGIEAYILIGYSLGGRIALYHACRAADSRLRGLFVEGAHPGLASPTQRRLRLLHDKRWAHRFSDEPLERVLADWYRQAVFSDLSAAARVQLLRLRAGNQGRAIAAMLDAASLARQPDLLADLGRLPLPFGYLCGERDSKFSALAQQAQLPWLPVPAAGHNAHRGNPQGFARQLLSLFAPFD